MKPQNLIKDHILVLFRDHQQSPYLKVYTNKMIITGITLQKEEKVKHIIICNFNIFGSGTEFVVAGYKLEQWILLIYYLSVNWYK